MSSGPVATRILERVEQDNTPLGVIVVDEIDRLPVGMAHFQVAVDAFSWMPTGMDVSFESPGYRSTMRCLLHSIKKKPDVQKLYHTIHPWDVYGLPEQVVTDHGSEYDNKALADGCFLSGILSEQAPVGAAWLRPRVERFFRTTDMRLTHLLEGSTFMEIIEKGGYKPEKTACISLQGINEMLHTFIVDDFASNFHENKVTGFHGIPRMIWENNLKQGFLPPLPTSLQALEINLFQPYYRILHPEGIQFQSLIFQSPDLARLRGLFSKKGKKQFFKIKVNPGDLWHIYVLDPFEQTYIRFDCTRPDYSKGLSLWKHRIIRNNVLTEKSRVRVEDLIAARLHIQEVVENEFILTKRAKARSTSNRYRKDKPSEATKKDAPQKVKVLRTTTVYPVAEREDKPETVADYQAIKNTDDTTRVTRLGGDYDLPNPNRS